MRIKIIYCFIGWIKNELDNWEITPEKSIGWILNVDIITLSKTTKLILLDSLLQEVCIKSGSQPVHISLSSGLMRVH